MIVLYFNFSQYGSTWRAFFRWYSTGTVFCVFPNNIKLYFFAKPKHSLKKCEHSSFKSFKNVDIYLVLFHLSIVFADESVTGVRERCSTLTPTSTRRRPRDVPSGCPRRQRPTRRFVSPRVGSPVRNPVAETSPFTSLTRPTGVELSPAHISPL